MHKYHIVNMKNFILREMEKTPGEDALEDMIMYSLTQYWRNRMAAVWTVDDVRGTAERYNPDLLPLSDEFCRKVLDKVLSKQNCSVGINWNVINHYTLVTAKQEGMI